MIPKFANRYASRGFLNFEVFAFSMILMLGEIFTDKGECTNFKFRNEEVMVLVGGNAGSKKDSL